MTYTKDTLRQIFQQPFNMSEWQQMLQHYFHAKDLRKEPEPIKGTTEYEKGYYLGALDTSDSYRIGLFYYQIQRGNVARKRVGLRNLVKSFINPNWGEFDAALVVFDSGSVWRLSFVCDIKGENTAAKRFTYVFGESDNYYNTPVGRFDALQRNGISFENIKDAFSVERLNKDFFNGYKERYVKFLNHINEDTKDNRDYVKKLLGRLVFLQFLQKKGWMGVPANQQGWNGGDKFYLNHLIERYEGNDRLLSDVLEPLFFNTLNERRTNDLADSRLGENIKIPYLNGGLFDKDDLDKKDIDFPYDYFKELMDFFAMYNFTIDENDPEDSEIGIDPEMLGHIFENLLEDNKDKGAFYTPKEIVQYMSQESVAQYLKSHAPEELHTAIDSLIKQRVVEPILQNKENARLVNKSLSVVKVCDPAIGSGAFPMGVLNVLFDCRHLLYGFIGKNEDFSYAKVKRDIIQNNIYGVDIEKGAVDIARLRFWLALVVDENEPQPLPNLDYKIMCGDSLLHRFALDAPFQNVLKDYNQKNGTHYTLDDYRQWVYDYTDISDHTQKDNFRQKIEDIKRAVKTELNDKEKGKIAKVRGAIDNLQMEDMFGGKKNEKKIKALQKELKALEQQRAEIESNKIYDQAFEWRFEFPALLDEKGDFMGFDIVIANPPYVDAKKLKLVAPYLKKYEVFNGAADLYTYFYELALSMLCCNGVISFITSNKWIRSEYGRKLRKLFLLNNIVELIDFGRNRVFNATVDSNIAIVKKASFKEQPLLYYFDEEAKGTSLNDMIQQGHVTNVILTEDAWLLKAGENYELKSKIESNGIPLKEFGVNIYRGILTGYNKAYHIDKSEKDKLIQLDSNNKDVIKPLICGGDTKKFFCKSPQLWIINIHNGVKALGVEPIKIGQYPIIKQKLDSYYSELLERNDKGCTPYNLRNCAYLNEFEKEKIVWQAISKRIAFAYDPKGSYYCDVTTYFMTGNNLKYILAILNSKLFEYALLNIYLEGDTFKSKNTIIQNFPIPKIEKDKVKLLIDIVDEIVKEKGRNPLSDTTILEHKIDLLVYHLYGLTYDEVLIVDSDTPITREEYEKQTEK